MKPAVATVSIYTFLQCWNELMFANIFISDMAHKTLPVGVQALSGQYLTEWGPVGAAMVLATFPMLLFYVFFSRKIQDSFIAGAIKVNRILSDQEVYDICAAKGYLPLPRYGGEFDTKKYGFEKLIGEYKKKKVG